MSTLTATRHDRAIRGTIRRRLLVNATVDPEEAARRLPAGLHPHVTGLGTVVGCCLLEIDHLRPAALPETAGVRFRAAAHRISVEWDDRSGGTVVGVYVPLRHTDSHLGVALGGRWFPGVHRYATVRTDGQSWKVEAELGFGIRVAVESTSSAAAPDEPVAGVCLGASIGLSSGRAGVLEAARMEPDHHVAREACLSQLDSAFLDGFASAVLAPAYLMEDVGVTWTRA